MADLSANVANYLVLVYGGPDGNAGKDASISLGVLANAYVSLNFYPEGTTLPPNKKQIHGPTGFPMYDISYRYAQMANVLDLLRNEKPIKIYINDTTLGAQITTSDEPVGEAEK
jgi:hypothetical protein